MKHAIMWPVVLFLDVESSLLHCSRLLCSCPFLWDYVSLANVEKIVAAIILPTFGYYCYVTAKSNTLVERRHVTPNTRWDQTNSMKTLRFSSAVLEDMAAVGFCCLDIGWNCFPLWNRGWLCGSENVTRASIDMVVSRKWVKFQFWLSP